MRSEQLGVFNVQGQWKLYREAGEARVFPSRREAVARGEALASELSALGRSVELFIEDTNGELRAFVRPEQGVTPRRRPR